MMDVFLLISRRSFKPEGSKKHSRIFGNLLLILLAGIIVFSTACSSSTHRRQVNKIRMNLPDCVIVKNERLDQERAVDAYKNVLSAVALNWRLIAPEELTTLKSSGSRLILVIPMNTALSLTPRQIQDVLRIVETGCLLVSEGITPLTKALGVRPGKSMPVRYLQEAAYPDVEITWEKETPVTTLQTPDQAVVLNRERDTGNVMVCMLPHGRGACLLLAAELDPEKGEGYARFPYFLHELHRAGIEFPFRGDRLSALFDYAYRINDNPDVLAEYWRQTGICDIQVGAWNFFDDDDEAARYLDKLIDACHRKGILVYAWMELPHVSTAFWNRHPQWREKTANGRDARVDWRLLMNLKDPGCFDAVVAGMERMLRRFDWDGVNLGELYFESPSGAAEPENFTPLNTVVRSEYKLREGIDPVDFFREGSSVYWKQNASQWKKFVEYRIRLEKDLNERFMTVFTGFRNSFNPSLDLIVTYVDNIYDPTMREAVGADVNEMFGLLDRYDFTLVLEDPWTVWNLGPRRYAQLADTYSKMTRNTDRLGIDINIVDRQKAYPTEKQTGVEFLELFYYAGSHFKTVMAYAEQTILLQDAALLSCALSSGTQGKLVDDGIRINSPNPVVYRSGLKQADFNVDGKLWPCVNGEDVLLPAGSHLITVAKSVPSNRRQIIRLTGNLLNAAYRDKNNIEFSYSSHRKTIAIFNGTPKSIQLDKEPPVAAKTEWIALPAGLHNVQAVF